MDYDSVITCLKRDWELCDRVREWCQLANSQPFVVAWLSEHWQYDASSREACERASRIEIPRGYEWFVVESSKAELTLTGRDERNRVVNVRVTAVPVRGARADDFTTRVSWYTEGD